MAFSTVPYLYRGFRTLSSVFTIAVKHSSVCTLIASILVRVKRIWLDQDLHPSLSAI